MFPAMITAAVNGSLFSVNPGYLPVHLLRFSSVSSPDMALIAFFYILRCEPGIEKILLVNQSIKLIRTDTGLPVDIITKYLTETGK